MSDLEGDLQATAEDIAADAARLKEIEEEKARLDPSDPRVAELAAEGEGLAGRLVPKTAAERELADEAAKGS
jgi:hypothetical protein